MERTIKKIQLLPYSLTADHIPLLQGILGKKQGGEATVSKLTELILTGKLRRVEQWRLDPSRKAMRDLVRVHGIGPTTAAKLVAKGVSSVQDLKLRLDRGEKNIDVSACVKTGLLRFDDLQLRIPRDEVRDVERAVFEAAQRVMQRTAAASTGDSPDEPAATAVTALAVGSYRRGAASCGDVDILITSELWRSSFQDEANCQSVKVQRKTFLNHLLDDLEQSGFLTDRLASAARYDTKKAGASRRRDATLLSSNAPPRPQRLRRRPRHVHGRLQAALAAPARGHQGVRAGTLGLRDSLLHGLGPLQPEHARVRKGAWDVSVRHFAEEGASARERERRRGRLPRQQGAFCKIGCLLQNWVHWRGIRTLIGGGTASLPSGAPTAPGAGPRDPFDHSCLAGFDERLNLILIRGMPTYDSRNAS